MLEGKKINFLGDSITIGEGTSDVSRRFSDLIAARYGAVCRNYGIGGTRIAPQRTPSEMPHWDLDFCARVAEMDPDADVIFVLGGTNDFGHGDAPFGTMADRAPTTFYGALHTLYRSLIEKYPRAIIAVGTPLHRRNEECPGGTRKSAPVGTLADYVDAIKEVAAYYALPVLDLYSVSGLQPNLPVIQELYVPDKLHPNDAGHEILARKIGNFLDNL